MRFVCSVSGVKVGVEGGDRGRDLLHRGKDVRVQRASNLR